MDQVTQQNAAMVEQSTAASHALSQEATHLSGLVGQFQVGQTAATEKASRAPSKAQLRLAAARPEPAGLRARRWTTAPRRHAAAAVQKADPDKDGWQDF